MAVRKAEAEWQGSLTEGKGQMKVGSGAFSVPFGLNTRMGDAPGTNPEELIGAAHAGCFSMAFSAQLSNAGHPPTRIHTTANVLFDKKDAGWTIHTIELNTEATVPGISEADFQAKAAAAKAGCPVSRALTGVEIKLTAKLL